MEPLEPPLNPPLSHKTIICLSVPYMQKELHAVTDHNVT